MAARLPEARGPDDRGRERPQTTPLVAIVDDDEAVRESLRFALLAIGHASEAFASPEAFLKRDVSRYFCIITDQRMAGMTGLQMAARLMEGAAPAPILLTSGDLSPEERRRAAQVGVTCILEKPLDLDDVAAFVARAADLRPTAAPSDP